MELKDLNDTLEAHAILDLAFKLRAIDFNSAKQNATGGRVMRPMKDFIPEAVETYGDIREAITAAQKASSQ